MSTLLIRPASMADAEVLHAWRNDNETRRASRRGEKIEWPEHEAWLSRCLASSDHVIRIAEQGGKPVGVVRADRAADGWELSWTVAPEARGRGIGGRIVKMLAADLEGRIVAAVWRGHVASERVAAAAGLQRAQSDGDFDLWVRA